MHTPPSTHWHRMELPASRPEASTGREHWPAPGTLHPPWHLFLAQTSAESRDACLQHLGRHPEIPAIELERNRLLPLSLHEAQAPVFDRAWRLVISVDQSFFRKWSNGSPILSSPDFLMARLEQWVGAATPGEVAIWGREDQLLARAPELLTGRGSFARLEIYRGSGPPMSPSASVEPEEVPWETLPTNTVPLDEYARVAFETSDAERRGRITECAAKAFPEDASAQLLRARSLVERGKWNAASGIIERTATREPLMAAAQFELGRLRLHEEKMDQALQAFERVSDRMPRFSSAWANAGAALGEMGQPGRALVAFETAVGIDPMNHVLQSNLGTSLRDLGRLEEAENTFRLVIELAPEFVFGHYHLAHVLYLRMRYTEAIARFESARELDPSRPARQHLLLAAARLGSGDVEAALDEYQELFTRLEPSRRKDMRRVAEWDLEELAKKIGLVPGLRRAEEWIRANV